MKIGAPSTLKQWPIGAMLACVLSAGAIETSQAAGTGAAAPPAGSGSHGGKMHAPVDLRAQTERNCQPATLPEIARRTMTMYFGAKSSPNESVEKFVGTLNVEPRFRRPGGVFVTISKKGKTRACWGSATPEHPSIAAATAYATLAALTKEYRFTPIHSYEQDDLKIQVTVIKAIEPIGSINFQNPVADGLLVRAGGRGAVLLPGEASDAHYQLIQCKLKAGIKAKEKCQMYRLRCALYRETNGERNGEE